MEGGCNNKLVKIMVRLAITRKEQVFTAMRLYLRFSPLKRLHTFEAAAAAAAAAAVAAAAAAAAAAALSSHDFCGRVVPGRWSLT